MQAPRSHTANNLDLMRLCFAALVLLSHAFELIDGDRHREPLTSIFHTVSAAELGVDCFFILSGFLITASWRKDPRWQSFLWKRATRIVPGFVVAYLISVVVVGAIGAGDAAAYFHQLDGRRFVKELLKLCAPVTPPVFAGAPHPVVNGAMWTIHYEFACYLLTMALGLAGVLARSRVVVALWGAALALLVAYTCHPFATGELAEFDMGSVLRFLTMFLAGAAMFRTGWHRRRSPWLIALAVAALVAGLTHRLTAEPAIAVAGAYLLFVIGFTPLRHPEARAVPDVSYGLYLYGWPMQKLVIFWLAAAPPLLVFVLSLAGGLAAGTASWFLVEKPAMSFRRPRRVPAAPTLPLAQPAVSEG